MLLDELVWNVHKIVFDTDGLFSRGFALQGTQIRPKNPRSDVHILRCDGTVLDDVLTNDVFEVLHRGASDDVIELACLLGIVILALRVTFDGSRLRSQQENCASVTV